MPQILLDALLASHRMELMRLMELTPEHSLSDTFSGVKALTAALDHASDLCFIRLALNLAENLKELKVNCLSCNDFGKVPSAKAWSQLSTQIAKAKIQHLTVDHFIVTPWISRTSLKVSEEFEPLAQPDLYAFQGRLQWRFQPEGFEPVWQPTD